MLKDKKLLLIAQYPIKTPLHGGQKRVSAFFDFYKNNFAEVRCISVFDIRGGLEYDSEHDFPVTGGDFFKLIDDAGALADYAIGEIFYSSKCIRDNVKEVIQVFQPDIIEFEQIYPYIGVSKILKDLNYKGKLILNSQNIESTMKLDIISNLEDVQRKSNIKIEAIKDLEIQVSKDVDLVIAVSADDARIHKKMGAKSVRVIRNGIDKKTASEVAKMHWMKFKTEKKIKHFITYIGSAHPPNLIGFRDMVGFDNSFIKKGVNIALAGSISEYIEGYIHTHPQYVDFWKKAQPLGRLSDDNLTGLIEVSELILLPITSGGGSNLKTAEAIVSGRKVLATSYAFRSFEEYKSLPNVYIEDDPIKYRELMNVVIEYPYYERSQKQIELAESIIWENSLRNLINALEWQFSNKIVLVLRRIKRALAMY